MQHPAHSYYFDLPQDGRVRIDLRSQNGDPVMSLVSLSRGVISATTMTAAEGVTRASSSISWQERT